MFSTVEGYHGTYKKNIVCTVRDLDTLLKVPNKSLFRLRERKRSVKIRNRENLGEIVK